MRTLVFLLAYFLFWGVYCQNLVPNPGFEHIKDCDLYFDEFSKVRDWQSYHFTPDVFNACSRTSFLSTPNNIFDTQAPHGGKGYAGILSYHWEYPVELIGTRLSQPLRMGNKYEVRFYVSRAARHGQYATNNIGLLFTNHPERAHQSYRVHLYSKEVITESENWVELKGVFLADQDYTHLVIGNFFGDEATERVRTQGGEFEAAYYFIDDVYVAPTTASASITQAFTKPAPSASSPKRRVGEQPSTPSSAPAVKSEKKIIISGKVLDADTKQPVVAQIEFTPDDSPNKKQTYESDYMAGHYAFADMKIPRKFTLRLTARNYYPLSVTLQPENTERIQKIFYMRALRAGQSIEMREVYFQTESDQILPASAEELQRVIALLNENPTMKIEISAITDKPYRLELLQKRARAIKNYLEVQGKIDPNRLSWQGYIQTSAAANSQGALADEAYKPERVAFKILN